MKVTIRAHAKINIDLRVLGVRPDGYHELRTVLQTIALHDRLTFVTRPGPFGLQCRGGPVPLDQTNLVWRAANLLWRALRREGAPRDVVAVIDKRIPVQAGLGGASADAAAALTGLGRLWGYQFAASELCDLAAHLGADVPFFLWGGTALGLGRGDEIYPLIDLPRYEVVIVQPPFGVSTQEAYAWYDEDPTSLRLAEARSSSLRVANDLEPVVERRFPEIGTARLLLRRHQAVAAVMSGSGSAVFGLFRRRDSARRAWIALREAGWRAILTRTVGRDEYVNRARPHLSRR